MALVSPPALDSGGSAMDQNKIKIAVVDDDEEYACALERLFRAAGFEVRTYPSAEAFLGAPPLPRPDCLVLDIHLGGMSGLVLQRQLRTARDVAPIIFVTADDSAGVKEEAEQAACSGYFVKPVERNLIIPAIKKAVHRPGAQAVALASPVQPPDDPSH